MRKAAAGALLLLAAVSVWRGAEPQPPRPRVSHSVPQQASGEWYSVLSRLDSCRNRLLSGRDSRALADCYASGSPAESADRSALAQLIARQVEFGRLPLSVLAIAFVDRRWSSAGEFVRLRVRDRLGDNQVSVAGKERRLPSRPPTEWEVTLWRGEAAAEWRWYEVRRARPRTPAPASGAAR